MSYNHYQPGSDRREELATAAMVRAGRAESRAATLAGRNVDDIHDPLRREMQRRRDVVESEIMRRWAIRYTELARLTKLREAREVQSYYVLADEIEARRYANDPADRPIDWPTLDCRNVLGTRRILACHLFAEWAL
jgi:hypothetical protein